jgi:hypothetical protein
VARCGPARSPLPDPEAGHLNQKKGFRGTIQAIPPQANSSATRNILKFAGGVGEGAGWKVKG